MNSDDELECCLCGAAPRHDGKATFYSVRSEGSARVTASRRVAVSLCDACATRVRATWRTRRLAAVGLLALIFGSLGGAVVAMSALQLALPHRIAVFALSVTIVLVSSVVTGLWLRDRKRELHELVAARYDVDSIFDQLEGDSEAGVSFEIELGRDDSAPRLETLAAPKGRRR